MAWLKLKRAARIVVSGGALAGIALAMGTTGEADASLLNLEFSVGDASNGLLTMPIYRAGIVPDEFLVLATPGNCQRSVQITLGWNEEENWVRVHIKGKGVLERLPSVERTEGVDFFPNPFWPEPEDFDDGRYLLWLITSPGIATFYYDVNTLQLLGSEYDFETPPVPSIPIEVPYFVAIPTPFFQPDHNGNVDVVHEYAYDGLVRPDLPNEAHTLGTMVPTTLCKADPYRFDRTSTRPYSSPRPAADALTWREFLENGLVFDLTVEPPEYFTYPPVSTNVGVYQGTASTAGNMPKGWSVDLEAFFGSIAPPIRPLPTAPYPGETCENWYKPPRNKSFDVCGPPMGGGQ